MDRKISAQTARLFGVGFAPLPATQTTVGSEVTLCGDLFAQGVSFEELLLAGLGVKGLRARPRLPRRDGAQPPPPLEQIPVDRFRYCAI